MDERQLAAWSPRLAEESGPGNSVVCWSAREFRALRLPCWSWNHLNDTRDPVLIKSTWVVQKKLLNFELYLQSEINKSHINTGALFPTLFSSAAEPGSAAKKGEEDRVKPSHVGSLEDLRVKLENEGLVNISYVVVNHQGPQSRREFHLLKERVSDYITVYQQDEQQEDVWTTLNGNKDDFLIYDRNLILMAYVKTSLKKQLKSCQRQNPSQQASIPIPACTDMDTTTATTTITRAVMIPNMRTTRLLLKLRDIILTAAGITGFLAVTDMIR
ncbi:hypothetical protein DUI87_06623 [Hirundo rustica rustica]|uniref:Selenoprotein P N-terminal domain-containing protein n=1 Tax=Hirundo rustica rustica TaxID=333673 RepID=A0A3M0KYW7_HIRRU|nr:hypothetical protein DUI87_06623 [Hirundo rustica rustica]